MFEDLTKKIIAQKVTTRNPRLADDCEVTALVAGLSRAETMKQGDLAVLDLVVVDATGPEGTNPNKKGETVSRTYPIQQPWALANLKRDLCTLAKMDYNELTDAGFKEINELAKKGAFTGIAIKCLPRTYVNKAGSEGKIHDIKLLPGKNDAKDVAKRAEAMAKGVEVAL